VPIIVGATRFSPESSDRWYRAVYSDRSRRTHFVESAEFRPPNARTGDRANSSRSECAPRAHGVISGAAKRISLAPEDGDLSLRGPRTGRAMDPADAFRSRNPGPHRRIHATLIQWPSFKGTYRGDVGNMACETPPSITVRTTHRSHDGLQHSTFRLVDFRKLRDTQRSLLCDPSVCFFDTTVERMATPDWIG